MSWWCAATIRAKAASSPAAAREIKVALASSDWLVEIAMSHRCSAGGQVIHTALMRRSVCAQGVSPGDRGTDRAPERLGDSVLSSDHVHGVDAGSVDAVE